MKNLRTVLLGLLSGLVLSATAEAATVSLTSPTNNQVFTAPASVSLKASTSGTGIAKVEFYQGTTLIGSDSTSPYSFTWSSAPAGSYSLTAQAKNSAGTVVATSSAVAIVVNAPPTVSLTSPVANQGFATGSNIVLTANAADGDGSVSKVDFYRGTTPVGTATTSPYTVTWSNAPAGSYSLTAKATDNRGATKTSSAVAIVVAAPPTVTLTAPLANQVYAAPANVTLTASASPGSGGMVSKVEFYQGTTLIGTATSAPYSVTWSNVPAGSYSLTARATDNRNISTTSIAVAISVNAAGPAQGIYFIHPDHLGTPRVITNEANQVVWRWDNDEPFGDNPANENPAGRGPFRFDLRLPGQYFDQETGTHYNYFRDYDPVTGRYVQSDPIGLAGGLNTYSYVNGNPVSFIDPDGLLACTYDIPSHTLSCTNNAGQSFSTNVAASGLGQCRDNPQCVDKPGKGPLPPGAYTIQPPGWSQRRPKWLYLDPDASNQMHRRGGFFIHPWGITNGCVILHIPDFNTISGWANQDGGGTLDVRD